MKLAAVCLTLLAVLAVGCGETSAPTDAMRSQPVTVLKLKERALPRERTLTGSVNLYREEEIGFEVSGRVLSVLDPGREVRGPAFNEQGVQVRRGDRIAVLESTRYQRQLDSTQARLDARRRELEASEAQLTLAGQSLERQRHVLEEGAGAQQAVDDAQSAFDQASSQLKAREASVAEVLEQLESAREDVEDTTLYAPFSGRITAAHIAGGAVAAAGSPVVTLTLMDPVQIQVEVSADNEREIRTGDRATIHPKDPLRAGTRAPINAIVFEKRAVADPRLRTFRIDLIVRNQRQFVHDLDPSLAGLPVAEDYLPVVREYQGETGPMFVPVDAILREGESTSVLRLPGVSFHEGAHRGAVGSHTPERVEIELGDDYTTVINWNFRSVRAGDLVEGDFLILRPVPEFASGVVIGRPQWLLRPNDLVPVEFELGASPRGFYVPIRAITLSDRGPAIFTVVDDLAVERPVTVNETVGELRRIEGAGVEEGATVVVQGVHYLSDGQPVTIASTEVTP